MKGAQGSSEGCGGHFTHIYGHKASGQTGVKAHHEPPNNEHLPGCPNLREAHQCSGDKSQDIGHEHGVPPEMRKIERDLEYNININRNKELYKEKYTRNFKNVKDNAIINVKTISVVTTVFHLPKRLTNSPTEKDPMMPPTEKMATDRDHRVVKVVFEMLSLYRSNHVSLRKFSMIYKTNTVTYYQG